MKRYSMFLAFLYGCSWGPSCVHLAATAQSTPGSSSSGVAFVLCDLTSSLNGKKLKPGSRVKAEITQDVLAHGKIVIPAEAKIIGHVTEVKSRGDDETSRLGIVFDKIVMKHHEEMDFQGLVQAVEAPVVRRSLVDQADQMMPPGFGARQGGPATPMGNRGMSMPRSSGTTISSGPAMATTAPVIAAPANAGITANPARLTAGNASPNQSLSVGMPHGVFGLKGLSLGSGSNDTPGAVILSKANSVKLDYGTQILVKITNARLSQP